MKPHENPFTGFEETAAQLGLAIEPVDPPASLKASVMAKIADTPQRSLSVVEDIKVVGPVERGSQLRWFNRPIIRVASVAAAVLLIAGGILTANAVSGQVQYQQSIAARDALKTAPDAEQAIARIDGGGEAKLVWSKQLSSAVIFVNGLAALPSDEVYQLWYIDDNGPRKAGAFTVDSTGKTWHVLDGTMDYGDIAAVTVEAAGGVDQPTSDPIVAIECA
jgi:Anti-sigma-K factor rskA